MSVIDYHHVLSCLQSSSIRGLTTLWMILLHSALSSVALKTSCNPTPVQPVMLFSQFTCRLPLARLPSSVPWVICFSRLLSVWSVCPQKDSFLVLTAYCSLNILLLPVFRFLRDPFVGFTARCTIVRSAVFRLHVVCLSVCPSVRPSVCDVGKSGPHRLEILENNCTDN